MSATTVRYIFIILKQAFDKAIEWKIIESSPVTSDSPKRSHVPNKVVWSFDDVFLALESIDNDLLHLAVHMGFACTLRPGEIVGLTWDCVNFDEQKITINKTLQRFSDEALKLLPSDEILRIFPKKTPVSKSNLVLKIPKLDLKDKMEEKFRQKDEGRKKVNNQLGSESPLGELDMASLEKFLTSLQEENPEMHKQVLNAILSKSTEKKFGSLAGFATSKTTEK